MCTATMKNDSVLKKLFVDIAAAHVNIYKLAFATEFMVPLTM